MELFKAIGRLPIVPKTLRIRKWLQPCLGVRTADCNIYVRSEQAGQRVMKSITHKLNLKVNEAKSAVAQPQERKFLGFSFTAGPEVKRVLSPKTLVRSSRPVLAHQLPPPQPAR
jgi:hypothetical protein